MAKRRKGSDAERWFSHMLYTSKVDGGEIEMRVIGAKNRRVYVNDSAQFTAIVDGQPDNTAVYYGVAFRKEPLKGEGASDKTNILGTDLLWAEVDTEKIGWDTGKCLKAIHSLPPSLRPSACVNSGYGLHLYWRLKEPLAEINQIEQANVVLRDLVSGDNIQDCTRILRVPGSTNYKHGKSRECCIVWCYHWQRMDVSDLVDAALNYRVLWDGKWISAKKRDRLIAARKADINDNAYKYAWEDRNKKVNARGLKVWEKTAYHGGPGMFGVDEAIMLFTAYMYCVRSGEAKRQGKRVSEESMDQIVKMAAFEVEKIQQRDAPRERWDYDRERVAIRQKLDRWARKWDGGLSEKAEQAYKEKTKGGGTRKVQGADDGSRSKLARKRPKAS